MERYVCKECGAPASVTAAGIARTCAHDGVILLDMTVTCYGEGHVDNKPSRIQRAVDIITSILRRVRP